jgi:hypothetical protein
MMQLCSRGMTKRVRHKIAAWAARLCPALVSAGTAAALLAICAGPVLAQAQQQGPPQITSDEENCLICHRYPMLGRYDEDGNKRIYYVNGTMFTGSVHGKMRCKDCHVDLDKIPHEEVKPVDCTTKCHVKEPTSQTDFSHKNMVEIFEKSVHGKGEEGEKKFAEDLPTCKYCHDNRSFNPYEGRWGKSEALALETLSRCRGCHKDKEWTNRLYAHFTHRMRQRRTQDEIVRLCTSCHENKKKMERHGLEPVTTYKDTFHWSLVKYDVPNAPDCISCHVPVGYTTHEIRPQKDPQSPINAENRVKTCSNQGGIQNCHPGATESFARGRVHAYGTKVQMLARQEEIEAQRQPGEEESPMLVRAREEISEEEVFRYKVLTWIKLLYQVLIGAVIGFMSLHQLLDFRRTRKRMKTEPPHGHGEESKNNGDDHA